MNRCFIHPAHVGMQTSAAVMLFHVRVCPTGLVPSASLCVSLRHCLKAELSAWPCSLLTVQSLFIAAHA
jgi:hypothetical protein